MNRLPFVLCFCCAFLAGRASRDVDLSQLLPNVIPPVVIDDVAPVPGEGKHVVIIEETQDRPQLPQSARDVLTSTPLKQWLANNGWQWRIFDADTPMEQEQEWFRRALAVERTMLPWIVIGNGNRGYSGPLPPSVEAVKELVGRYQ